MILRDSRGNIEGMRNVSIFRLFGKIVVYSGIQGIQSVQGIQGIHIIRVTIQTFCGARGETTGDR